MTEETNIQPIRTHFEQIGKTTEGGQEYWSALRSWKDMGLFDCDGE